MAGRESVPQRPTADHADKRGRGRVFFSANSVSLRASVVRLLPASARCP